ncbi:MAG: rhodanese-like sulfurtransferase [Acidobacteria bacterium]|nr:rhodanese-like sulfurtransferase [Acidobacteriota bacterium]
MSVPRITKEELKSLIEAEGGTPPVILDARLKYPYEHSTVMLKGAVRLNPNDPSAGLSTEREIVAYDSDPEELVSAPVAAALIRKGYRAKALQGGLAEWVTAKFPTDEKDAPKQAPPEAGGLKD